MSMIYAICRHESMKLILRRFNITTRNFEMRRYTAPAFQTVVYKFNSFPARDINSEYRRPSSTLFQYFKIVPDLYTIGVQRALLFCSTQFVSLPRRIESTQVHSCEPVVEGSKTYLLVLPLTVGEKRLRCVAIVDNEEFVKI